MFSEYGHAHSYAGNLVEPADTVACIPADGESARWLFADIKLGSCNTITFTHFLSDRVTAAQKSH